MLEGVESLPNGDASVPFALRGRWILPIGPSFCFDGVLTIQGERIVAVGENQSAAAPIDLGDAVILPGFVNAHTHLEFSDLTAPLGRPGMSLADWIPLVVEHRRAQPATPGTIARGLRECLQHGVTTVGEIAQPGWSIEEFESLPIDAIVFLELLGLRAPRRAALPAMARTHTTRKLPGRATWRPGLSPHAPYTVHPRTLDSLATLMDASQTDCQLPAPTSPLAMHLAESREELELLRSGTGRLVELLRRFDAWDDAAIPRGSRPLDYLRRLGNLHDRGAVGPVLAIHGNYLAAEEIEFLARRRACMSLVYCPRTHAYFGHDRYPLERLLTHGVRVAVGTDSRASNPNLSVLAELRYVAAHYPAIPPPTILRLGTEFAAAALGLDSICGTLTAGKLANLTVIPVDHSEVDPVAAILHGSREPMATMHRGRWVDCSPLQAMAAKR